MAYDVGRHLRRATTARPTRTVGANAKVRVDTTGPEAFGSGDTQLFAVLKSISDSIRAGDSAKLTNDLKNLDKAGIDRAEIRHFGRRCPI